MLQRYLSEDFSLAKILRMEFLNSIRVSAEGFAALLYLQCWLHACTCMRFYSRGIAGWFVAFCRWVRFFLISLR